MTTASRDETFGTGELTQSEVDGRFADLVTSNYADEVVDFLAAKSAVKDVAFSERYATPDATHIVARAFGPRDWPTTPEVEALEDAQSHFSPPDPRGVMATSDPIRRAATIGAVGFPLLTILAFIARAALSGLAWPIWPGPLFGVLFLLSLGVLLWRMPKDKRDYYDNGAVV